jgi:drug/metabolite transporter (DMT)-like permease
MIALLETRRGLFMKHILRVNSYRAIGVILILISAISFGVMPIFARLAYESGADPLTVLFLRFGVAAVVMLGIMFTSKTPFPRGLVLLELVLLGAIGYVGESLAYFTALKVASPGLVALLLYIYPALVTALSAVFLKEHLTTPKVVALFLALSGTALTIQMTSGGSAVGFLLGIAAAVDYAIYILLGSRIVRRSGSIGSTTIIIASTAGVYAIIAPIHGLALPANAQGWVAVLAIALISTVLSFVTFFAGLKRIGPTNASTLSTFEPIVAVALAAIVLGETITPVQALGGVLILIAVVVLSRNELRQSKQQASQGSEDALDESPAQREKKPELVVGGHHGRQS